MNFRRSTALFLLSALLFTMAIWPPPSWSRAYRLDAWRQVFGDRQTHIIRNDAETLVELARRHDLGYNEITDANQGIDPWYPGRGKRVFLPTAWIMPEIEARDSGHSRCIVINLAEMRLYFAVRSAGTATIHTFPIGIAREGIDLQLGRFRIVEKKKNPYWVVPASIKAEHPELADAVPPGPDNPLGDYALRLSQPDYLIHGTNKPLGIGRRVSHGCIRMYPEDIEKLFALADIDCPVIITYQPLKVGFRGGIPHIEVHRDFFRHGDLTREALYLLQRKELLGAIDTDALFRALKEKRGYPVPLL